MTDDLLTRLKAERPDLAAQLSEAQIALLEHVLFPAAELYRDRLISARGMAHPFREDFFKPPHAPRAEEILNVVHLWDEIDTEEDAMHASMHAALPVVAEIWRWRLKEISPVPFEVRTADDKDEYGPTLYFRRLREEIMKHFALFYDFAPDFRDKRAPFRAAHLALANEAAARGEIVLAGAFADDPPGGMLLFKAESASVAEAFARADPYVVNGVATGWRVREWTTVVGAEALTQA